MAQWFWSRWFFKLVIVFSQFCNCLPFEKVSALHLNKLASPSPKDALCQVWLKLAQWFWRRRWIKWSLQQWQRQQWQRRTKDKFCSEKLTRAFGSGELKKAKAQYTLAWLKLERGWVNNVQWTLPNLYFNSSEKTYCACERISRICFDCK